MTAGSLHDILVFTIGVVTNMTGDGFVFAINLFCGVILSSDFQLM